MNEMRKWELDGVGHADAQLIGDAAVYEGAKGTVVIGTWVQGELIEVVRALMTSGFEVLSVRRLDANPQPG